MVSPSIHQIIKYIPLQQGLRLSPSIHQILLSPIIKYIPLQQGLRHSVSGWSDTERLLSIFHYNKD